MRKSERSFFHEHPYLTVFGILPTLLYGGALVIGAIRGTPLVQSSQPPAPDGARDAWQSGDGMMRGNDGTVVISSDAGAVKAKGRVAADAPPFVWTNGDKLSRKPGAIVVLDRNGSPKAELAT